MKKVLLVDDDALVRMFLRQIIPWEREGYTVVGDARDGEEALEMEARFSPDVIISDVSMPMMDGVQLVEEVRRKGFAGGIIMLSCHDDFDNVKNAMQRGADEYLLKNHLNAEDLCKTLQAVTEKHGGAAENQPPEELRRFAEKGQRVLQQELFERLLAQQPAEGSQRDLLRQAGMHGVYENCAAALTRIPRAARDRSASFFDLCFQIAAEGDLENVEAVQLGHNRCAFLIDLTDQPSAGRQMESVQRLCSRLGNRLEAYLQVRVSIGVSTLCTGADAISHALRQADQAFAPAFYGPAVRWYGTEQAVLHDGLPAEAAAFAQALPGALDDAWAELERQYARALESFRRAATQPGEVLRWLQDCDRRAGVQRTMKTYAELERLDEYPPCLAAYRERVTDAGHTVPDDISAPVAAAIRYLQAHFTEPVTLGDAAAQAGFHPSYFSTVFKQEVGVGFSEYLTDLRLAQVRRRLAESADTIKDIARQAGFFDYQHFCKTFKKKTTLSPAEFRKANRKKTQPF